jgi:1-deoxy-D-xylulose-5-phosphate reductoisomerase
LPDLQTPRLPIVGLSQLTFEPVRSAEFPMLDLGIRAARRGGTAPAVYNAAKERAVELFLDGQIAFGDIAPAVEETLASVSPVPGPTRSDIMHADAQARRMVENRFECSRS